MKEISKFSSDSRVVALPCAGGAAINYRQWQRYLPCDMIAVEYSGHWTRFSEPLGVSFESLAEDARDCILSCTRETDRVFLFGHSMGGVVAWLLSHMLSDQRQIGAVCLSACLPPHSERYRQELDFRKDSEIKSFLEELRQVPREVLYSDFFDENLLPAIRSDLHLLAHYCAEGDLKKTEANIVCFLGESDPLVSMDEMRGWSRYTSSAIETYQYQGNHFYLYEKENIAKICAQMCKIIDTSSG